MSEWCRNNMYIIDLLCVIAVVNLNAGYNTPIVTISTVSVLYLNRQNGYSSTTYQLLSKNFNE